MSLLPPHLSWRMPFHTVTNVLFCGYTTPEIKLLSVKEVSETATFDELGHAQIGGMYDPAFGPSEWHSTCVTCGLPENQCPGHVGHISLVMPVFHPIYFKFVCQLLKGTCVFCHRLFCSSNSIPAKVYMYQMSLLDQGYITAAEELAEACSKSTEVYEAQAQLNLHFDRAMAMLNRIDAYYKEILERHGGEKAKDTQINRNRSEVRDQLTLAFLKAHIYKRLGTCPHCRKKSPNFKSEYNKVVILDFTVKKAKKGNQDVIAEKVAALAAQKNFERTAAKLESDRTQLEKSGASLSVQAALDKIMGIKPKEPESADQEDVVGTSKIENVDSENIKLGIESQLDTIIKGQSEALTWAGGEVRDHFRLVWKQDKELLRKLFPLCTGNEQWYDNYDETIPATEDPAGFVTSNMTTDPCPMDVFFPDAIAVPPIKFRPITLFQGQKFEHPQTNNLRRILEASELLKACTKVMQNKADKSTVDLVAQAVRGKDLPTKFRFACSQLQARVNMLFDVEIEGNNVDAKGITGIKQLLEKKEGLFRKHMMGKRVNYACRTVITPDPYLAIDEIGVPEVFAKRLTYPEFVNSINVRRLRVMVKNGPKVYPGANFVIQENGVKVLLSEKDLGQRTGFSRRLSAMDTMTTKNPKQVLRHLVNNDILIMNRQPTLHKPSMMGHRARVLKNQKALRMNYAPCKAYNADFDGDEMNGHYMQNELSRAEAYEIATARQNYLVPKDGTPILGLIQDHVVSGVLLTIKDRFFTRDDYHHLLLSAFQKPRNKLKTVPPAILKPVFRWTGKQVLSSVILNVLPDKVALLNLDGKAKTGVKNWQVAGFPIPDQAMSESHVVIRGGELLVGVLDKAHYGATAYGLIHCCFELYGPQISANLLSAFSRLFTTYLQYHGFTLGVKSILVTKSADKQRRKIIRELRNCGDDVVKKCFGMEGEEKTEEELKKTLEMAYCKKEKGDVKQLDYYMKKATDIYNDRINKALIPHGLIELFPNNCLQLMIESGAKGTMVNSMQISCLLGQIELEGCRPPVTASGRTLPSFKIFDPTPRAGGFVEQRFLTGVKPQELFFHTMAGREGLIDTAVKTSRSGYLQRCIIKHLEGLMVNYDLTVREYDRGIIQFRYGEDGLDIGKAKFLNPKQFEFLAENRTASAAVTHLDKVKSGQVGSSEQSEKLFNRIEKWKESTDLGKRESGYMEWCMDMGYRLNDIDKADNDMNRNRMRIQLAREWSNLDPKIKGEYAVKKDEKCPDPVDSVVGIRNLGCLSEKFLEDVRTFEKKKGMEGLKDILYWKAMQAASPPGDCVGLMAAQSIGEPSTQMTLNTFHFAGRGEMNVTLGIPRLREILMTASRNISTPAAQAPFLPSVSKQVAELVRRDLDRVFLKSVLKSFTLRETLTISGHNRYRRYTLILQISHPKEREEEHRHLTRRKILLAMEGGFFRKLSASIKRKHEDVQNTLEIQHERKRRNEMTDDPADGGDMGDTEKGRKDEGESSDEEGGGEGDADSAKLHRRHDDGAEYEGEEEEETEVAPLVEPEDMFSASSDEDDTKETVLDPEGIDGDSGYSTHEEMQKTKKMDPARVSKVMKQSNLIEDYKYDPTKDKWCSFDIKLPLQKSKLDVTTIVRNEIAKFVVQTVAGVEKCMLAEEQGKLILKTQGINLQAFFAHANKIDVNKISANNIHTIADTYGVEAAGKLIGREVSMVFGCYGIEVDPRHLSLIADYMTQTGGYRPFNRHHMQTASSPLQKMSFESTTNALRAAMLFGQSDNMESPSAKLVLGQSGRFGTNCFDLITPLKGMIQEEKIIDLLKKED